MEDSFSLEFSLAEVFSRTPSVASTPLATFRGHQKAGLLDVIEPLLELGCERLRQGVQTLIQTYTELPFDIHTIEAVLFASLPDPLIEMLNRSLILELKVARLQGLLSGTTPEERFQSFLQYIRQPKIALRFLQEYPVLTDQITRCIHNWVTFSLEFLQHLCADWQEICTTFNSKQDPGLLVQVDGSVGDRHRDGRAVLIAQFSSRFQVVYKPKSLAVEVHFQELLAWLNQRGDHPPFYSLKVLDRHTYGWVEFIAAQSCSSPEQVKRFYQRQGGYLALLYLLEATDFHYENLIASGEHPVLLDLEALFHPRIQATDANYSYQLISEIVVNSVLRVGLLPHRVWTNAESEGVDLSGLGGAAGQLTPYSMPQWEGMGTDEMRLTRKRIIMQGQRNRPMLNSEQVNAVDYTEEIVKGFTNLYRLLLKCKDELLSDDSPLFQFAKDEVRVILRPTQTYAVLLRESFHPDLLRNLTDRIGLFSRLRTNAEFSPALTQLIPFELKDLCQGDIPLFTTHPESRHLWSSKNEQITDFFDQSGLVLAQQRVQHLSEANLLQQIWFIRASLTTLAVDDKTYWPSYRLTEPQLSVDSTQLLAVAQAIGERLETLSLHSERDVSWIGLTLIDEHHLSVVPLWLDLYDGLPGVTLFLAYLGKLTDQKRYTSLAQAVLTTIRREIKRNRSFLTSIGGFGGWGGIIYTLTHLGVLWHQPELLAEAEAWATQLSPLIEQDKLLDMINGAAGCLASLLSLYHCAPSDRTLAVAVQCGDHLLAQAQSMKHGIGWQPQFGGKPLTGFSHGAAGIAWALLELSALTGEERFRQAAIEAIAYERSLFLPEVSNWPDLRSFATTLQSDNSDNDQPTCMTAWCHGAPGIGLARLRCLKYLDDAQIRSEINAALKTTLTHGFGSNHSLCHGDLGNLELLLQASELLDDPQWQHQVNRISSMIVNSIHEQGWLCGIPLGVESPGLMTGLAGIGYELLRLAEPALVPSVLVLEPPKPAVCLSYQQSLWQR